MFKRLGRALGSKARTKARLDVEIAKVQGLPGSVTACRVVWARDAKVQMTKRASVENGKVELNTSNRPGALITAADLVCSLFFPGIASWNEELSIIATLDKDSKGRYEPKVRPAWPSNT